eukprot:gnl/MRDRNA2_/MRDRNA2_62752_c0_seq1.p1 gnl/MRDRNA2_/MRDRNA2_62752_c0~~gnl/MRDRNA2_/MRDRNA2_62752_c0_seq1.p1  ORF type:complete len:830 (+),score=120.61 gnl/MRDRNA2_/MRDRNA2_62752_c0_seq1:74-2563(+)
MAPPGPIPGGGLVTLQFQIECTETQKGEAVFVVGSLPQLGSWDSQKAVHCSTQSREFPIWTSAPIKFLASSRKVEFKLLIQPDSDQCTGRFAWAHGESCCLKMPDDLKGDELLIATCSWGKMEVQCSRKGKAVPDAASKDQNSFVSKSGGYPRISDSLRLPMLSLQFQVKCSATKPGQAVFVSGSLPELGAWNPEKAIPCTTGKNQFPIWTSAPIKLVMGTSGVELRLLIKQENSTGSKSPSKRVKWAECGACSLSIPADVADSELLVAVCTWGKLDVQCNRISDAAPVEVKTSRNNFSSQGYPRPGEVTHAVGPEVKDVVGDLPPCFPHGRSPSSRFKVTNSDGSFNVEMSRTASRLLVDFNDLEHDAEEKEKEVEELDRQQHRDSLNRLQRRIESNSLLEQMREITDFAEPSQTILLQGFNWESWKAGKGDWYSIVASKVDLCADMGITDIWLPPPSQSVAPQGYLPSQLFNLDGSKYGTRERLEWLLQKMHDKGIRGVADIVINHRCGDKQDSQGRWNVFTSTGIERRESFSGVMDWQGWAVTLGTKFSDGSGQHRPGKYDQSFDAAPDIDHANLKVQKSISIWLRWLRLQVGFDAWRFDFSKGYSAEYAGFYCRKSGPAWAVGELWGDMQYNDEGLEYNQDRHRQDLVNWINATGKACTAFDFTTKGILQEAVRNCQYWRLRDERGKPPGLLGWMPKYAVTFIDNHDTGSTQAHWPFPGNGVLVGYAYTITHPGIPCIFWDHIMDWGDDHRRKITDLIRARRESRISVDAPVRILCADHDLYKAEIGSPPTLRVALGPRAGGESGNDYWRKAVQGRDFCVCIHTP